MPYNNPIKKKDSACKQLKSEKGKPTGLMMEGSVNHMSMLHKEADKQEVKNLEAKNPVAEKASVLEMSPLNDNHDIDPKTGKRVVQPFVDPGAPEGFESSMGKNYDEEEASRVFTGAQNQAQNALNIARQQLEGTDVINQRVKGYGTSSIVGPSASQVITGYSTDPTGKKTFNKENVQAKLNELDKLAITDPVKARSLIKRNISGAPLGDFRSKFMRDVNPFNN